MYAFDFTVNEICRIFWNSVVRLQSLYG
jgi:hypothetical protein